jgi:hypothetical protein
MEDLMARVLYDTGSALLDFDRKEVMQRLASFTERHGVEIAANLSGLVFSPADESAVIPSEMTNFRVLALQLFTEGIGRATCKACAKTMPPGNSNSSGWAMARALFRSHWKAGDASKDC